MKINTSKATAHDRISPKLLKDSADIIAESLTVIFNKSIETGIFPDDLKVAYINRPEENCMTLAKDAFSNYIMFIRVKV